MREKIGYAVGDLACNLVFQTISIFLLFFYTDIFGISAAAASTLFLVARLWDAINDPIMGSIVDKTHTRWGKFRPYLLFGAFPFALFGILCFSTPDFSATGKLIYAYVTYIALGMIYTVVNVPYGALTSAITQDPKERTSLSSIRMLFALAGGLAVSMGIPSLSRLFGGDDVAKGYQMSMGLFSIIAMLLLLVTFATTKERYSSTSSPKTSLAETIKMLKDNRPLLILSGIFIVIFGNNTISGAVGIYFFRYVLQDAALFGLYMTVSLLVMMVGLLIIPLLLKKLTKKQILYLGLSIALFKHLSCLSTSLPIIFTGNVIGSIGFGFVIGLLWGLVPDTIEYGEYTRGVRAEGMIYAIIGFAFKVGMALGGLVPGFVLQASGYVPDAVQSTSAIMGIRTLMAVVPVALLLVAIFGLRFYTLDEKTYASIIEKLRTKGPARQEA
jgi:glycoside/pentoside/hexuronide:cation symporter, GPH family